MNGRNLSARKPRADISAVDWHMTAGRTTACSLALAFDGHVERCAHLSHAVVAESSEALDKDPDGHALDGVEVDRGSAGNWIVAWL
jgi:hypothetical protein